MPDARLACLGECGSEVTAAQPFCGLCTDRMPEQLVTVLRCANETRDPGLLLYAVTQAWSWHVLHPRGRDED